MYLQSFPNARLRLSLHDPDLPQNLRAYDEIGSFDGYFALG